MKFKEGAVVYTADPYYDLFDGGYISPDKILEDPADVKMVEDAIKVIETYLKEGRRLEAIIVD